MRTSFASQHPVWERHLAKPLPTTPSLVFTTLQARPIRGHVEFSCPPPNACRRNRTRYGRTRTVRPCSGQLLHVHEPHTMNSLAADNLLAHSRTRTATLAIWLNEMPSTQKPADAEGKLGQAQRHKRVVQYLRKRVSYATINVTHSGTSAGRLAQRERRCLTSTRSQVQILYRPPLKSQVRHYSRLTFSFSGKSRASKCPRNSRQSATQVSRQYALPIKMDADLRRRPKTSALSH